MQTFRIKNFLAQIFPSALPFCQPSITRKKGEALSYRTSVLLFHCGPRKTKGFNSQHYLLESTAQATTPTKITRFMPEPCPSWLTTKQEQQPEAVKRRRRANRSSTRSVLLVIVFLGIWWHYPVQSFTMWSAPVRIGCKRRDAATNIRSIITRRSVRRSVPSAIFFHKQKEHPVHVSRRYQDQRQQLFASLATEPISVEGESELSEKNDDDNNNNNQHNDVEAYLQARGIKSRPVEGGKWNVRDPLGWARNFGRRSPEYEDKLKNLTKLGPGDEGYHDVSHIKVPGVTIVRTKEEAQIVLERLYSADRNIFHAADTEVMDIDVKEVGPVGNGYVTCLTLFSGEGFDYGLGDGPGTALFVDNLDDSHGLLQEFKDWLEDERYLKVWHNYGFDRHVLWNEGIDVKGFGGDTMHMARLQDTSRVHRGQGYSLEALSEEMLDRKKDNMKTIFGKRRLRSDGTEGLLVDVPPVEELQRDPQHRFNWVLYAAYDAHSTFKLREKFQQLLMEKTWLKGKNLWEYYWMHMRKFGEVLTDMERRGVRVDARDYLASIEKQARLDKEHHSKVFRTWASKQYPENERAHGLGLNPASSIQLQTFLFGGSKNDKTKEISPTERIFTLPREDFPEDALEAFDAIEKEKEEAAQRALQELDPLQRARAELDLMKAGELKELCKNTGLKRSGKKDELKGRLLEYFERQRVEGSDEYKELEESSVEDLRDSLKARGLHPGPPEATKEELLNMLRTDMERVNAFRFAGNDSPDAYNAISKALEDASIEDPEGPLAKYFHAKKIKEPSKKLDLKVISLGLQPITYTAGGAPSATSPVLSKLAGDPFADPPKYGTAYDVVGKEGCEALFSLCSIGSIDTMIANFLGPLQKFSDVDNRVHCALNLNTDTGRLSSRRPNLQNQPALEKDKYKIRQAFQSSPGHNLIVADYGQLELRILASLTDCRSMIEAFELGGDFHSRTALDMFDYIQQEVKSGEVLLEWDYSQGDPPKPLLKDKFASERRKAKTLNFSIAYGKTAHGLSADWGVSREEAEEMLQKWYEARPEVENWQKETKKTARNHGITRTLHGRYRQLPGALSQKMGLMNAALRASINTPIQGGAADVAMMAMIKINNSQKLKDLGWILLLQVHDEVMLEGPEETAEEAFEEVIECMQEPWVFGLDKTSVPLLVDGSCSHKNWYEAK